MVSELDGVFSADFLADLAAAAPSPSEGRPVAVPLEGPFASPSLWAERRVLELADAQLGDDYVVASLLLYPAGAALTPVSAPYDDATLPPCALSLLVPLDGGPAALVDARQPVAPFSAPTVEVLYSRPWYVDPARLDGGPCLRLPRSFLPTVSPALARLFARAAAQATRLPHSSPTIARALLQEFAGYWQLDQLPAVQANIDVMYARAHDTGGRLRAALSDEERRQLQTQLLAMKDDPRHPLVSEIANKTRKVWTDDPGDWRVFQQILARIAAAL